MSDVVIRVEDLGKLYRIGQRERYRALRDVLARGFSAPFRTAASAFRRLPVTAANPRSSNNYFWALKDVSFEVKSGEIVGIIGRNGAGKSTLLKILSRITEPTEGYAEIHGRVGSLLEVGTGFHPELTGRENIYLNGAILGMKKHEIDRRFGEIVDFAEVEKFIDTPVKYYSSGMYVRLAFAVAAHLEPEILLVDEVLAVGDIAFQQKCFGKMGQVTQEGRTVLIVSHNMSSIRQLCSRSLLLEKGFMRQMGATHDIIALYLTNERTGGGEFIWGERDAPGDDSIQLKAIRLRSNSGEIRSQFGTHEPITVEVEYRVKKKITGFQVGFSLHYDDGTYVFFSADDDHSAFSGKERAPGNYRSSCQIPGNWLNTGSYYLIISGAIPNVRNILSNLPRLCLEVVAMDGPSNSRNGIFRPILPWCVTKF